MFEYACTYVFTAFDIRKFSFTIRIVNIWNSLPNYVIDANTVDIFKSCLLHTLFEYACTYVFTAFDISKFSFTIRIVNIWNSLPNYVIDANTVDIFKSRLDKFWHDQEVFYDFTRDITGTGDRSEC